MHLAEWNLRKFLCWRSVEQSFPTARVSWLPKPVATENLARRRDFRDRIHTEAFARVRSREDFILFPVSSVFAIYYENAYLVREKCSDVKRRLLRSIFARCTFLNANRARGNSWDFIALSFLHGLCIFICKRLRELSRIRIFKGTLLPFKYNILPVCTEIHSHGTVQVSNGDELYQEYLCFFFFLLNNSLVNLELNNI